MSDAPAVAIACDDPELSGLLEDAEPLVDKVLDALETGGIEVSVESIVALLWVAARVAAMTSERLTVESFAEMAGAVMHVERQAAAGEKIVYLRTRKEGAVS